MTLPAAAAPEAAGDRVLQRHRSRSARNGSRWRFRCSWLRCCNSRPLLCPLLPRRSNYRSTIPLFLPAPIPPPRPPAHWTPHFSGQTTRVVKCGCEWRRDSLNSQMGHLATVVLDKLDLKHEYGKVVVDRGVLHSKKLHPKQSCCPCARCVRV